MSTMESEGQPVHGQPRRRRPWVWVGAVLWGFVAAASVMLWQAERKERMLAEHERKAALEQAVPDPAMRPITLPLYEPKTDGDVIEVNIADLLSQASKPASTSAWDPEGIEDFAFTNIDGRTITKADLLGRPWAVGFIFTHCLGPCPTVTRQMKQLQDRLKNYDIRLVTLTVDPARDTQDVLKNYAKLNGADPNRWFFLTGDQAAIYGLIHRSFRMPVQEVTGPERQQGYEILHSYNLLLVDSHGVVQGKFNAAKDDEMAALRRELQDLAVLVTPDEPEPPIAAAER